MKNTSKKRSYLMLIAIFTMMICLTMAFGISASAEHDGAPAPEAPVEGMVQTYSVAFGGANDNSSGSHESRTPPVAPAGSVFGDNPEASLTTMDRDHDHDHGSPESYEQRGVSPKGEGTELKDENTSEETEETEEKAESEEIEGDELEEKGTAVEESAEEMVMGLENALGEKQTTTVKVTDTLFTEKDIVLKEDIIVEDNGATTSIVLSGEHNLFLNGYTITGTTTGALFTVGTGAVLNVYGGATADDTTKEGTITSGTASLMQVTGGELKIHSGNIEYTGSTTDVPAVNVTSSGEVKGKVTVNGGSVSSTKNGINADSSTVTVSGGTVSGAESGIYATSSTVTVSGGTVSSTNFHGIYAYSSEVTVSGGSVSSTNGIYAENSSTVNVIGGTINGKLDTLNGATITVFGGTFSDDPSAYLYTGFTAPKNKTTGLYEVTYSGTDKVIAVNVNTGASGTYATISDALTAIGTNGTGIIKLLSDVSENITISAGQDITLDLNGFTLTGVTPKSGTASVITVTGKAGNLATFTLVDSSAAQTGTVTGGTGAVMTGSIYGGGVYVKYGNFTMYGGTITKNAATNDGGGVFVNYGIFTMKGGTISENKSKYGGGVYVMNGNITMTGGTITNNESIQGGGVVSHGTFTMEGGTISGNHAEVAGGVIEFSGTFTMIGGEISGNTAIKKAGGGVYVCSGGTFIMTGGEISGNSAATTIGGGVYCYGTFNMTGGEISGNSATTNGGGVYCNGTFTMTGGEISGNTASTDGGGVYYYGGTVTVGGTAKITGNTLSDGTTASNLDLNGNTLSISTATPLAQGAEIGITAGKGLTAGNPFAFSGVNSADCSAYFTSDSEDHVINSISNTLYIGVPVAETADSSKYVTVQAAVDAAETTDTVKILTDVANDIVLNEVKEITLDLNGKTLTGTVTAKAGNISLTNADGTVTGDVTADGGVIAISNGTFGGDVKATNSGKVTIEGGKFAGTVSKDANSTFVITGGLFVNKPDGTYLDPKCVAIENTDPETSAPYAYKVVKGGYKVGDEFYASFDDAVAAAMDKGEPIVLFRDIEADELTESIKITEGTDVTLDLAGYSLGSTGTVLEVTGGSLIVTDTSTDKTGKITSTKGTAIVVTGGELTVTGISEISTAGYSKSAISVAEGGKVTIEDVDKVTASKYGSSAISVEGGEVTVKGVGEVSATGGESAAISAKGGKVNVEGSNVSARDNVTYTGVGIDLYEGAELNISGGSTVDGWWGITSSDSTINITENSVISGTLYGILSNGDTITASNSSIKTTEDGFCAILAYGGDITLTGCTVYGTGIGIDLCDGTEAVITGSTVTAEDETGILVENDSKLTLKDTVVTGPAALTVSGDKSEVTVEGRNSVLTGTEIGIEVISGRVTVKDGTVTGNDAIKVEGGKVKVLNGHIIGAAHAILALGGSADVFGGFIDGGLNDHGDGKITVYDGFFTEDPSAYIVSGYHAEAVYDSQGRLLGFVIAANTDEGTSGQGAAVTPAFTVTEVDASALNESQLEAVENLTASGKQEVVAYVLVTENDTTDSASEDASNGASDSNSNEIIIKAALLKGIDPSLIHIFFVAEDGSLMEVGFTVNANGDLVIANGRPGIYVITCANGDGSV